MFIHCTGIIVEVCRKSHQYKSSIRYETDQKNLIAAKMKIFLSLYFFFQATCDDSEIFSLIMDLSKQIGDLKGELGEMKGKLQSKQTPQEHKEIEFFTANAVDYGNAYFDSSPGQRLLIFCCRMKTNIEKNFREFCGYFSIYMFEVHTEVKI